MRFVLAALLLTVPAAAQPTPFSKVSEYLGLRADQVEKLVENLRQASMPDRAKMEELNRLRNEIAEETAKPAPIAIEIGQRYVQIEMICREMRERAENVGKDNLALLDAAQREKLKTLEAQLPLMQVLSEAMALRLIAAPVPGNIIPVNRMTPGMVGAIRYEASGVIPPAAGGMMGGVIGSMIGAYGCAVPMLPGRIGAMPAPMRDPMPVNPR